MVNIVSNIHICKYTPIDYQFINNSNGLLFADKTCSRLIDHIADEHEYYDCPQVDRILVVFILISGLGPQFIFRRIYEREEYRI